MNEKQLITRCIAGKPRAQRKFVDMYAQYIFDTCRRYARDVQMAEDFCQECLVRVLTRLDRYEIGTNLKAWIKTVTVRKCIELLRKEKDINFDELTHAKYLVEQENMHFKLEKNDVMKFIDTIPENYRIVIQMYLVEGYSHKEIAEFLGVSESSSRTFLARARKLIRQAFEDAEVSLFRAS